MNDTDIPILDLNGLNIPGFVLDSPPSHEELARILEALGCKPLEDGV